MSTPKLNDDSTWGSQRETRACRVCSQVKGTVLIGYVAAFVAALKTAAAAAALMVPVDKGSPVSELKRMNIGY